ncbi:hypothetical protein PACTADRAFT_86870 [Pachysolen tannophilus NRRL Y-2460]|uniref:Sas10 C-terminal domain-containing protein n=1 Tax=Pachysolen tannophilus NRRL Y-2460 TaxID=669874 RepID=A0A1E4TPZ3_PACTA|nr:hypothetical protein PACTADRAFT_86870 [Pachysolen tannophilus NRRL Y-2460]
MARRARNSGRAEAAEEEIDLDEVDAFNKEREDKLEAKAGFNSKRRFGDDEDSEEEVMALSEEGSSDDEEEDNSDDAEFFGGKDELKELQEGENGWGHSKEAYYGGDDIVDENDDETAKLMEEEALRQQRKHLEELGMDDYMDEDMVEEWSKSKESHTDQPAKNILTDTTNAIDISTMDKDARLTLLKTSYPEFIPLTKELSMLNSKLQNLKTKYNEQSADEILKIKFTALSAYMGSISSYFAIFFSNLEKKELNFSIKDHPVMESILMTREVWRQAEEIPDEINMADTVEDEEEDELIISGEEEADEQKLESESESELDSENEEETKEEKKQDFNIDINKKRNIKRLAKKRSDEIDDVDAEEKKARKRTLRFYTSKIDQQQNKKDAKYTGDMDIPYKERLFERQQRLLSEAQKRGTEKYGAGVDLDDNDYDSEEERESKQINEVDDESYYNAIKGSKEAKKKLKIDNHKQAVKAAKEGKLAELQENVDEDGKRAINYQILKNKGLTPHRKKENRNSRVKKRLKYEKAKKKLNSIRSVFTGEQGPYAGEKTGIKKGLSRSVKLV